MFQRLTLARAALLVSPLLPASPMLITESQEDFDRICAALNEEIEPRGIVHQMYVADIANNTWDILRLRRFKAAIINVEIRLALASLLSRVLSEKAESPPAVWGNYSISDEADRLAKEWFTEKTAKKQVSDLLREFQLDESAIEAEAFRRLAPDLERLDRMLASCESRRSNALRNIAESDIILARRLSTSSDRIIEGDAKALEHKVSKKPPTAA